MLADLNGRLYCVRFASDLRAVANTLVKGNKKKQQKKS